MKRDPFLFEDLHRRAFRDHVKALLLLILMAVGIWSGIIWIAAKFAGLLRGIQ